MRRFRSFLWERSDCFLFVIGLHSTMTEIDSAKERVAYLKVWLGIFVVTIISLIGWLVSNYTTAKLLLVVLDVIAILILLAGILLTHREINRKINEMESL